jgi:hypothetical protein
MKQFEADDLRDLARLIDSAIESDDERVKRAFSRLMTIVALVEAQEDRSKMPGSIEGLLDHIDSLTMRVRELEIKEQQRELPFSKYSRGGDLLN